MRYAMVTLLVMTSTVTMVAVAQDGNGRVLPQSIMVASRHLRRRLFCREKFCEATAQAGTTRRTTAENEIATSSLLACPPLEGLRA